MGLFVVSEQSSVGRKQKRPPFTRQMNWTSIHRRFNCLFNNFWGEIQDVKCWTPHFVDMLAYKGSHAKPLLRTSSVKGGCTLYPPNPLTFLGKNSKQTRAVFRTWVFLDALAYPSSCPCQSVSESVNHS